MTLKEFADVMRDEVAKHFNEDWQIEVQQHVKNNNWLQTQLMIRKKGEQVGMLIPMELFYPNEQDVLSDEKLSEISAAILCFYEEGKEGAENMNRCIPDLDKYQNIRDMVRYKIINAEKNSELLQSVPHILYLDLAIVFYICFKEDEKSLASGLIHNSHLDMWKVTVYDIYEDAKKNTPEKQPYLLENIYTSVNKMIAKMTGIPVELLGKVTLPEMKYPMYVLSNTTEIYGASAMLYPGILKLCSEKLGGDLLIIPSSTREVLLMQYCSDLDVKKL